MSNTTKVSPIETLAAATVKLEQLEEPRRQSRSDSFIHNLALARERLNSIAEAERKSRSNSFAVIQGKEDAPVEPESPMASLFYHLAFLAGPILSCAWAVIFLMIPRRNVLKEPEAWYEFHLANIFGMLPFFLGKSVLYGTYWASFSYKRPWLSYFVVYILGIGAYVGFVGFYYYEWKIVNGLNPPMPIGFLGGVTVALFITFLFNFFLLPKGETWSVFLKRFVWYALFAPAIIIVGWGYSVVGAIFARIPKDREFLLGFITPFVREVFTKMLHALGYRASGDSTRSSRSVTLTIIHFVEVRHGIFLAVVLGNATDATIYVILALDFTINVLKGVHIVYKVLKQGKWPELEVEELVLGERVETLTALTYMAVFAMSFYGPNATIMGTIKLSIFQYKAVSDLGALMQTLAFFWFVGFCSFLFNGILLYCTCKINVLQVMKGLHKDFWFYFAVTEATLLLNTIPFLCVGSGMDLTLKFEWSEENYVFNETSIATY